jgi:hypothetical protein
LEDVSSNETGETLRIVVDRGRETDALITKKYSAPQDWSKGSDRLGLLFKGGATGEMFSFHVYFKTPQDAAVYRFVDDSRDWKLLVFQKWRPSLVSGSVDWTHVSQIEVATDSRQFSGEVYLYPQILALAADMTWSTPEVFQADSPSVVLQFTARSGATLDRLLLLYTFPQHEGSNQPVKSVTAKYRMQSWTKYIVEASSHGPFILILSTVFDDRWRAHIDGHEASSISTYFFLNGFFSTGAGDHEIVLDFAGQRYVAYGWYVTGLTFSLVASYLVFSYLRGVLVRRKKLRGTCSGRSR